MIVFCIFSNFHLARNLLVTRMKRYFPRHAFPNKMFSLAESLEPFKLMKIWGVMDECIRTGVSTTERTLPGRLQLRRRAPMLYRRLMRG